MDSLKISRFLIVGEDLDHIAKFKALLGKLRYQSIATAQKGEEALEMIESKRIQFIIMSWNISPMKGSIFVQRIQANERFCHIPVLVYSDVITDEEFEVAHKLGFDNLILWPNDDSSEAEQIIKMLISKEETLDETEHRIRQANLMRNDKQYDQAINTIKPALGEGAFFVETNTFLGEVLYAKEEVKEAEKVLDKVIEKKEGVDKAKKVMARIYSKTDRYQKAVELLEGIKDDMPYSVETLITLGVVHADAGEHDKAREEFKNAKALDPTNEKVSKEEGKLAFKEGKFELAASLLANISDLENVARDFNNRAVGLIGSNRFEDGIKSYQAALDIIGYGSEISHLMEYNLGIACRKSGDLKRAYKILSDLFERLPDYTKSYAALVKVVKEMEKKNMEYDKKKMLAFKKIYADKTSK